MSGTWGILFDMKLIKLTVHVPCTREKNKTQIHPIRVFIDPDSLEIVKRTSPCGFYEINYVLAQCAKKPPCIELFDTFTNPGQKAYEQAWIVRQILIKSRPLRSIEQTIARRYAERIFLVRTPPPDIDLLLRLSKIRNPQAMEILLKTLQQVPTVDEHTLRAIHACDFAQNERFTPHKVNFFAEINRIAIQHSKHFSDPDRVEMVIVHPIYTIGRLVGIGKSQAAKTIWSIIQPAIVEHLRHAENPHAIIQKLLERYNTFLLAGEFERPGQVNPTVAKEIHNSIQNLLNPNQTS